MTPVLLTAALGGGLVALALIAPWLLRQASPALVRVPRLAVVVLGAGVVGWLGALLALGPVLAWAGRGPALLPPGRVADVCQRCLAAANPFSAGSIDTMVPTVLLLALPAALGLALGAGVTWQLLRRRRRSREAARQLLHGGTRQRLHGHEVSVVGADHPFALAFPVRHGGIAVSSAAIAALDAEELAAVLAHEQAHLRERHHLVSAVVSSVAACLRWVPLVSAVAAALPHYLEIAADNQARRRAGTPALVSALVKLGDRAHLALPASAHALHAAGPERVRQLVRPSAGGAGALPALVVVGYVMTLAVAAAAVPLPYVSAALSGCM